MSEHSPNRWEIVKFKTEEKTWYKVLGGWSGGYLDGDSWRMSSGLESISEDGDYYLMKNSSGSIYKCHKEGSGMTMLTSGIYTSLQEQGKENEVEIRTISVEDYIKETK